MATDTDLQDLREQFMAKQTLAGEVFELLGKEPDFTKLPVMEKLSAQSADDAKEKFKALNREVNDLGQELERAEWKRKRDEWQRRQEQIEEPESVFVHPESPEGRQKTLGDLFVESKAYREGWRKNKQKDIRVTLDIGLKTLFETTAGFAPESVRSGLVVPDAVLSLAEVVDLMPAFPISQPQFVYMEETTRTHAAAETAEGAAFPESTFVFTQRTSTVRKIADSIPVTDEQLEDEGQARSLLDQRLRFGLRRRLATQILTGDGTGNNLEGVLNVTGIQTQAKGTDSIMAAAYKAMTLVRFTGAAEPSAFVFHPNDWQDVVLSQETTGPFIWGHPSMVPMVRLWGLPVAVSTGITENTALCGDFRNFARLDERRGISVQAGYVGTQFTEGEITLRADLRTAFTVTRPAAMCTITGI